MTDLLAHFEEELDQTIAHAVGIEGLKGKSVLIAGATGTIGSWIAATLLRYNDTSDAEIKVFGTSRRSDHRIWADRDDFQWVSFDLAKDIDLRVPADYIIHAAGNGFPAMFCEKPVETALDMIDGTARLLRYAGENDCVRFLYISSGEVYGVIEGDAGLFSEDMTGRVDPLSPRSSYPLSKRLAENLCISWNGEYGVDVTIARCCHTFGPVFPDADDRAHTQFIRASRDGRAIVLNSKGENVRSYLFVADCVAGLLTILMRGDTGAAYNVCDRASVLSIRELAEGFAEAAGTRVLFDIQNDEKRRATPILRQTLDDSRLRSLGWTPCYSIKEGIERTLREMRPASSEK